MRSKIKLKDKKKEALEMAISISKNRIIKKSQNIFQAHGNNYCILDSDHVIPHDLLNKKFKNVSGFKIFKL